MQVQRSCLSAVAAAAIFAIASCDAPESPPTITERSYQPIGEVRFQPGDRFDTLGALAEAIEERSGVSVMLLPSRRSIGLDAIFPGDSGLQLDDKLVPHLIRIIAALEMGFEFHEFGATLWPSPQLGVVGSVVDSVDTFVFELIPDGEVLHQEGDWRTADVLRITNPGNWVRAVGEIEVYARVGENEVECETELISQSRSESLIALWGYGMEASPEILRISFPATRAPELYQVDIHGAGPLDGVNTAGGFTLSRVSRDGTDTIAVEVNDRVSGFVGPKVSLLKDWNTREIVGCESRSSCLDRKCTVEVTPNDQSDWESVVGTEIVVGRLENVLIEAELQL